MKVIIDIPKELYENKKGFLTRDELYLMWYAVANGVPLPKRTKKNNKGGKQK